MQARGTLRNILQNLRNKLPPQIVDAFDTTSLANQDTFRHAVVSWPCSLNRSTLSLVYDVYRLLPHKTRDWVCVRQARHANQNTYSLHLSGDYFYRMSCLLVYLGWVDFDLGVLPSCPDASAKFPSALAEWGWLRNAQNPSHPTRPRCMSRWTPCIGCVFQCPSWGNSSHNLTLANQLVTVCVMDTFCVHESAWGFSHLSPITCTCNINYLMQWKERMNYYCEQDVKKIENSYAIIILIVHCPSQSHYGIKKTPISTHQRYVEPHSRICDRIATAKLTVQLPIKNSVGM